MPTLFVALFPVLMMMVPVWFVAVVWVFRRLRTKHPETYEQLGSPTLIWNNSMRSQWLFGKFMFTGQHKLGDADLSRVIIFMRVWFIAYMVLFLALVVSTSSAVRHT